MAKVLNGLLLGLCALLGLGLAIFTVILFVGSEGSYIDIVFGMLIYCGIIIPPTVFIHQKTWRETRWWLLPLFSLVALVIFVSTGGALVANNVTQLAGISQPIGDARYYLIDKQLMPFFRGGESLWRLENDGEKQVVFGYKSFQLSDVTVLCPAGESATKDIKGSYKFCAQLKSSELLALPRSYVALSASRPDTPQSGVPVIDKDAVSQKTLMK